MLGKITIGYNETEAERYIPSPPLILPAPENPKSLQKKEASVGCRKSKAQKREGAQEERRIDESKLHVFKVG